MSHSSTKDTHPSEKYSIKMGNYFSFQPNSGELAFKGSQSNRDEQLCNGCRRYRPTIPIAAMTGHSACLEALIKAGITLDKRDRQSVYQEALEWAAQRGELECVNILIEAGADMNKKHHTHFPRSAVEEAAFMGNEACLNLLIKAGGDVNRVTKSGQTILMKTVRCGHPKCVSLLIEAGADVNAKDPDGCSAITCASAHSPYPNTQILLQILIDAGADVNNTDKDGNTPLILVRGRNVKCHIECVKLLLRSGAKVSLFNNNKLNALCRYICESKELNKLTDRTMVLFLYAAGETLDGITINEDDENTSCVLDYLDKREINLKELCREAIGKHLLYLNLHQSLFGKIPQLGLPELLSQYLLCDMSLDTKTE